MPWGYLERFPVAPALVLAPSKRALAKRAGLSYNTLVHPAGLTLRSADRVATAVGMHPADLWPGWFAAVIAAGKCGTTAGYHAHVSAGETACNACLEAERLRGAQRRLAARFAAEAVAA